MWKPRLIAFDADDTLWENETLYHAAQDKFVSVLSKYHEEQWIRARLYETEMRNMAHFGYGIKAFVLSMIETSVELTEGRVTGQDVGSLVAIAKHMIEAEIKLLPGVRQTVETLHGRYPLAIITKGDLLDQQRKVDRSGIGDLFAHVEIVADKNEQTYAQLIKKFAVDPADLLMIGNSMRSDILPILELGGSAVYIPHELTWSHEHAPKPETGSRGYFQMNTISELVPLIEGWEKAER